MVAPSAGEVVLVPFPFSDLSQSKVRPAICLAAAGRGDWICCQVTGNAYSDPLVVPLDSGDFVRGGLSRLSYARPAKLFTLNRTTFLTSAGKLNDGSFNRILTAVVNLFQRPATP